MGDVIGVVAGAVEKHLKEEGSGHDWQHIYRVWQTAMKLAKSEKADETVVALAVLLHEVDDYKLIGDSSGEGDLPGARAIMAKSGVDAGMVERVCGVLKTVGFRKTLDGKVERSLEAHVVSDADMLDAIGAVGIGRTMTYCGNKGFGMFDPEYYPAENLTKEEYMKRKTPSVTHFFEKLLKLRGMMFTEAGKREAAVRHGRMVAYLDAFFEEAAAPAVWKERLEAYR